MQSILEALKDPNKGTLAGLSAQTSAELQTTIVLAAGLLAHFVLFGFACFDHFRNFKAFSWSVITSPKYFKLPRSSVPLSSASPHSTRLLGNS